MVFADISIHALREESDHDWSDYQPDGEISIHALREESDPDGLWGCYDAEFQSTLSVRRATGSPQIGLFAADISIHALREESDSIQISTICNQQHFNPRSP